MKDTTGVRTEPEDATYITIRNGEVLTPGAPCFWRRRRPHTKTRVTYGVYSTERPMLEHLWMYFETKTYNFSKSWNYQPVYPLHPGHPEDHLRRPRRDHVRCPQHPEEQHHRSRQRHRCLPLRPRRRRRRQHLHCPPACRRADRHQRHPQAARRRQRRHPQQPLHLQEPASSAEPRPKPRSTCLASKNVTIENNTIEGVKTLVRKDDETTLVERGNQSK